MYDLLKVFVTCRLSARLRTIPAAASERRALLQLDPFHLAQLALKDASKAADLSPSTEAYYLQASPVKLSVTALELLHSLKRCKVNCVIHLNTLHIPDMTAGLNAKQEVFFQWLHAEHQADQSHYSVSALKHSPSTFKSAL